MNASSIGASKPQWRFSLAAAFGWLFVAAAYFSILGAFLVVVQSARSQIEPSTVVAASFCWLGLGVYYFFRRHYGALFVHSAPLAFVLAINLLTFIVAAEFATVRTFFYIGALCSLFALPLSLANDLWWLLVKPASPQTQFAVNLLGAVLLSALVCSTLRSLGLSLAGPTNFYNLRGMMFGAILGVWFGCYMATSTSPPIARIRVLGFSARALATGGLLGGLFGPLLYWYLADTFGYYLLPGRLSPLLGIATALAAGVICWRPRSAENV